MTNVSVSHLEVGFVPTCSVWFGSLDVKVACLPQYLPDIFLKIGEQPTDIFST